MVYIFQDIVQKVDLSDLDVAVWCFLSIDVYSPRKSCTYVTGGTIASQMYGKDKISAKIKTKVSKSIEMLINGGYVIGHKCEDKIFCIESNSFEIKKYPNRYFCEVEEAVIRQIINSKYQPINLLRQYLLILSATNYNTKSCIWKIETFANITGKEPRTIATYINTLEKMKLIYVHRSKLHTSNTCGRYEDKEEIEKFAQVRMTSNDKRRITQLKNWHEEELFA